MSPDRKHRATNGVLVEEYYWAGKLAVYIDHHCTTQTYSEACAGVDAKAAAEPATPTGRETCPKNE